MSTTIRLFLSALLLVVSGGMLLAGEDSPYQPFVFTGANGDKLPYRLLTPEGFDPKAADAGAKKYPLVVFLHGAGERGEDNIRQLHHVAKEFLKPELRKKYPCFVLAPQCPQGKRWVEVNWGDPKPHTMPESPSYGMTLVLELIPQILKEYPIDQTRVYAAGISMGGYGTWDLLARRPEWFAAGIPVCGGADLATAPKIAQIPLWVWHGDQDKTVPTVRSQLMVEALKKAGGNPKYTELPGIQHNSWSPAFKTPELYDWLFQQQKKAN